MNVEKVNEFIEKQQNIHSYFPEWSDKKIYEAIAGIKYDENPDKFAYRQGLFVLRNSDEGIIKIANNKQFIPKAF